MSTKIVTRSLKTSGPKIAQTLFQFLRFGLVGGLNTFIDVALFNLLVWMFPVGDNVYMVIALNSIAY